MKNLISRTGLQLLPVMFLLSAIGISVTYGAHAAAEGALSIAGSSEVLAKTQIKVTDPNDSSRQFDPTKFTKVEAKPDGVVSVASPTTINGDFEVTPQKSGEVTLTIEYKVDDATILKGTKKLVVPYKSLDIAALEGPFFIGKTRTLDVSGVDIKSGKNQKLTEAEVTSDKESVVKASFVSQKLKLEAQSAGSAKVTVTALGVAKAITVEVIEAVERVEIGGVSGNEIPISIPEGETRALKIRIIGAKGTEFKANEVKMRTDPEPSESTQCVGSVETNFDPKNENTLNVKAPALTGNGCTSLSQNILLTIPKRNADSADGPDFETRVNVTVTQKLGFIKLSSSSLILTQNGRITISAEVFGRNNIPVAQPPDVSFGLRDPDKDAVWVGLVKEGNKATLVWRNPSQREIKEKNDNQVVSRPSEIVVIANTQLSVGSPQIESRIIIGMGEVVGFDFLQVKLNLMDERTASDLYGKVTSDEYYVLTVRLFNNLKDEITKQFTGDSILAYSSSIEVAVQLEKKFDRKGSDSYFPYVISKSEAERRATERMTKLSTQFDKDMSEAVKAQQDLNDAVDRQYDLRKIAITNLNTALEKKTRAEKLALIARGTFDKDERRTAADKANHAITEYNEAMVEAEVALEAACAAEDEVIKLRSAFARAATGRALVTPESVRHADPDTAIDDGLWHPLTSADLNRLGPTPEPSPAGSGLVPLQLITESEINAGPKTSASVEVEPKPVETQDPPCVGVITYRPFTFEMMVNTVDRRDTRSRRSRAFRVLDFIGTSTSFVTAVAVPGPGSDLPLGLEKYRNLLLPGLDKIFPSFKEQQRQNIVSQAMKEIEEIPFGSDITRVIFIPKRNIHGLVRGHDVRISEVCPFFFRVQVAIVKKHGVVEQGTIAR